MQSKEGSSSPQSQETAKSDNGWAGSGSDDRFSYSNSKEEHELSVPRDFLHLQTL